MVEKSFLWVCLILGLRVVDRVLVEESFNVFDFSVVGLSEAKEEVEGLAASLLSERRIFLSKVLDTKLRSRLSSFKI